MSADEAIAAYVRVYAVLLRLYPKPFRERFAEEMERTFGDLCRERAQVQKGLSRYACGVYLETLVAIFYERRSSIVMPEKLIRVALVTAAILAIPAILMQFHDGEGWSPFDFGLAGVALFATGLAYEWTSSRGGSAAYRVAIGIACTGTLLLLWVNGAVGIIGDGPVNLLFLCVPVVLAAGTFAARLEPRRMAKALLATAATQLAIPAVALALGASLDPDALRVLAGNAAFVAIWCGSAWMFHAAAKRPAAVA